MPLENGQDGAGHAAGEIFKQRKQQIKHGGRFLLTRRATTAMLFLAKRTRKSDVGRRIRLRGQLRRHHW